MRQKIEIGKTYKTRDGRAVRVLATDYKGTQPVLAIVTDPYGDREVLHYFDADGTFATGNKSKLDLIEVKPKIEGWMNVYKAPSRYTPQTTSSAGAFLGTSVYKTKDEADYYAQTNGAYRKRLGCIPVSFTEGEGLEEADGGC